MIDTLNEKVEIVRSIKAAVDAHTPDGEDFARADKNEVLDRVVAEGYERDVVLEEYDRLIRLGELYEVNGETVGVV